MNYSEYAQRMRAIPPLASGEYLPARLWLHPERLPVGIVEFGADTPEDTQIVKLPLLHVNRWGWEVPVISFSKRCFNGNPFITDVILSPHIQGIPAAAFAGCSRLRNITIPRRVTEIPARAFAGCKSLTNIYYEGTREEWKQVHIVHDRYEVEFGALIPGTPVQEIASERLLHVPGNEALFAANLHFRCRLEDCY